MGRTASELSAALEHMGFVLVDRTKGFRDDVKWRHASARETSGYGSVWVKDDTFSVSGKRFGGYERVLTSWVAPSYVDVSLRNPFSVWTGRELDGLLVEMARRITPRTLWPPPA
jgi:hypothetical protein